MASIRFLEHARIGAGSCTYRVFPRGELWLRGRGRGGGGGQVARAGVRHISEVWNRQLLVLSFIKRTLFSKFATVKPFPKRPPPPRFKSWSSNPPPLVQFSASFPARCDTRVASRERSFDPETCFINTFTRAVANFGEISASTRGKQKREKLVSIFPPPGVSMKRKLSPRTGWMRYVTT